MVKFFIRTLIGAGRSRKHNPSFLIVILALLLAVFSGCQAMGPAPQPVAGETVTPTRDLGTRPAATRAATPTRAQATLAIDSGQLKGKSIEFWHVWDGPAGNVIDQLVADFNANNEWGIQAKAIYVGNYDDLDEKVPAAIAAGSAPDLIAAYLSQAQFWELSPARLVDLEPLASDPIWGIPAAEQADYYPAFWNGQTVEGSRLGLPFLGSAQVLVYNASWAKELGFDSLPATPASFKQQACAAAKAANVQGANGEKQGGLILSTQYGVMLNWIGAFSGDVISSNGNGYRFNTPEARQAFTYLRDLYENGCAWVVEEGLAEQAFATRQGLFASGSAAELLSQTAELRRLGSRDAWTVIAFPSLQGEAELSVYGPSLLVLSTAKTKLESSPEALAAWLLARWLTSPESQAQLAQATGFFPVRISAQEALAPWIKSNPQWGAALSLLGNARSEPNLGSWSTVRWAVSDAATQLFRYYFTSDQVPNLVKLLDQTAADLHAGQP